MRIVFFIELEPLLPAPLDELLGFVVNVVFDSDELHADVPHIFIYDHVPQLNVDWLLVLLSEGF